MKNIASRFSLPALTIEGDFERYCKGIVHAIGPFWDQRIEWF